MRNLGLAAALLFLGLVAGLYQAEAARGQTSPGSPTTAQKSAAGTKQAAASNRQPAYAKPDGTLLQVMRGILFPSSNVLFFAQSNNPDAVKKPADPSVATDPLMTTYGGWNAVENASIAMVEAANLISIPGRVCSNGKPVPVQNADWIQFVQGLRKAGQDAYKAAQTKNSDKIADASGEVSDACDSCHTVYREKSAAQGGVAARCTK